MKVKSSFYWINPCSLRYLLALLWDRFRRHRFFCRLFPKLCYTFGHKS